MQPLSSITLHYDANEDRLLVAINAGSADTCGYWLTRRLALNLIKVANPYLDRMSPVVSKTPTALRGELATMEREVALARTQESVSQTPPLRWKVRALPLNLRWNSILPRNSKASGSSSGDARVAKRQSGVRDLNCSASF